MLEEMSEDQNHLGFKSSKKSPALMGKLGNFDAESIISKQLQVDIWVAVKDFFLIYSSSLHESTYCRDEMCVFTRESISIKSNELL